MSNWFWNNKTKKQTVFWTLVKIFGNLSLTLDRFMGKTKDYKAWRHTFPRQIMFLVAFKPWIVCSTEICILRTDIDVQKLFGLKMVILKLFWSFLITHQKLEHRKLKKFYTAKCPPGHWRCVPNFRSSRRKSTTQGEFNVPVAISICDIKVPILPFFENRKKRPHFAKTVLIVSIFVLNFPFRK